MKKTAVDLAEELVNKACELRDEYDGDLYSVLSAISEDGADAMINFPDKKVAIFYTYEEFCKETDIEVSKEDFPEFIEETKDCVIGLIYEKMDELPNPSYFEAMSRTLYFDIFPVSFKGKYKICAQIHACASREGSVDAENLCLDITKIYDAGSCD